MTFALSFLLLWVSACGGGSVTLSEYATQLEGGVSTMNARLDEIDVGLSNSSTVTEVTEYWDRRVAAREEFLGIFFALDPPESAAAMHEAARDILTRLVAAETALGERASGYESVSDLSGIWESAEGLAARAIDQEAINICLAAQAMFDDTADREILVDVPWVTSELKEIIDVVFGCTSADR